MVVFLAALPLAFFVYIALAGEFSVWLSAVLSLVTLVTALHYLRFYYVLVNRSGVRSWKYFGLVDRTIPLGSVTEVASRPLGMFTGRLGTPSIAFCSANEIIEISTVWYWNGEMRDALRFMRDVAGVPVDSELGQRLRIDQS
jgi:hypothetical protein